MKVNGLDTFTLEPKEKNILLRNERKTQRYFIT